MKYKPIGAEVWDLVAREYNAVTGQARTGKALKKKFRELRDNLNCPTHVRDAIRIHRMINERVMLDSSMNKDAIPGEPKPEPADELLVAEDAWTDTGYVSDNGYGRPIGLPARQTTPNEKRKSRNGPIALASGSCRRARRRPAGQ